MNHPDLMRRHLSLWSGIGLAVGLFSPLALAGGNDAAEPVLPSDTLVEKLSKDIVLDEPQGGQRLQRPRMAADPKVSLRLHFAFGSAQLLTQGQRQLDQLASALTHKDLSSFAFELAGHTDGVGSHASNMKLSLDRSNAAKTYLIQTHGLPSERLLTVGFGFTRLADRLDPRSGANRRVEVRRLRLFSSTPNAQGAAPAALQPATGEGTLVLTPKTSVQ